MALAVVLVVFLHRRKATIHFAAAPLRRGTPGENSMEQISLKDESPQWRIFAMGYGWSEENVTSIG